MTPFRPPKGFETLLLTAVLGFMRPVPPTHKQELDALALTTHLIRLFRDQVLALHHRQESSLLAVSVCCAQAGGACASDLITLLACCVPSLRLCQSGLQALYLALNQDITLATYALLENLVRVNPELRVCRCCAGFTMTSAVLMQVLTAGQELVFDYQGDMFILRPLSMMIAASQEKSAQQGLLTDTTAMTFEAAPGNYGKTASLAPIPEGLK